MNTPEIPSQISTPRPILGEAIMRFTMIPSENPSEIRQRDGIDEEVTGVRPMEQVVCINPHDTLNAGVTHINRMAPRLILEL